ncbi:MAG TPA: 50S ribosomal protein L20 [Rubrobacteraceae bacterium]|nr:50S ribosomal protein L20 [Rubrobacteraceae bacterium]
MARTARSLHARKKRKKVLEQAKGYRGTKKSSYKRAKEQVWKGGVYAYAGRKQRKRDFRALWIQRINAGAREHGLSYSQFINGLRLAEVDLDRKILADLAATEPNAFAAVVQMAKDALNGGSGEKQAKRRRAQDNGAGSPPRGDEVEATKAAERRANELDVDLAEVEGSGSEGRVLVEDVEEAGGEISATDAARSKADELEVDLAAVDGTGTNERITVGDVENAAEEEGGKAE